MKTIIAIAVVATSICQMCAAGENTISHEELVTILGLHKWTVPMPKDNRYEWRFEIRDYREYLPISKGKDEWVDSTKEASLIIMPTGSGNVYRFWLKQANGTSSGISRFDVCDDPDDTAVDCDVGQFETKWFDDPIRIDDGKTYLVGELKETFDPGRRKQVVLQFGKFRLEDMLKDEK